MGRTEGGLFTVAPAGLLSTDSLVALAPIDMFGDTSLSYTIKVITNSVDWTVFGANLSDYSDEQVVQAEAAVAAGASGKYTEPQATYRHYRTKIKATVGGNQGTATVVGIAKP